MVLICETHPKAGVCYLIGRARPNTNDAKNLGLIDESKAIGPESPFRVDQKPTCPR